MTTPLEKAHQRIQEWIATTNECGKDNCILNLSGLCLTELPDNLFAETPNLMNLWLSHNFITHIPETLFATTPNLLSVSFQDNFISSIPETLFATTPNLQLVYLHDNRLTSLPELVFATNPSIQHVYIDGNRFAIRQKEHESIHDFVRRLVLPTFIRHGLDRDTIWNRRSAAVTLWSELAYA